MSTPEARRTRSHMSVRGYERNVRRRKTRLDVDLNAPPSEAVEETLTINLNVLETISLNVSGNSQHAQNVEQRREIAGTSGGGGGSVAQTPPMIDVEEIDDEVVISSPRRFAEARKKRRNHTEVSRSLPGNSFSGNSVQEATRVSLEDYIMRTRARPSQTIIDCEHYIDLESSNTAKSIPQPPPPPPPPKEPTFSCPVCMGPLVEEASTKCGHIFCKKCIKAAITAQNKCPTCRRKLTLKDIIRVYLPTTN